MHYTLGAFIATKILGPHCQNTSSIKVSQVRGNYHEQHFPLTLNHLIVSLELTMVTCRESIIFLKKIREKIIHLRCCK